jgi:hypothetical protein
MASRFAQKARDARPDAPKDVEIHAPTKIAELGQARGMEKAVSGFNGRMNMVQQARFQWATSACTRVHMTELIEYKMEEQKQRIKNRVMLAHDLAKKTDYGDYQIAAAQLDARIVEHSNEMDRFFTSTLSKDVDALYQEREAWLARLEARKLPATLLDRELQRMEAFIAEKLDGIEGKIKMLTENHERALESTLAMLGQRASEA